MMLERAAVRDLSDVVTRTDGRAWCLVNTEVSNSEQF